MKALDYKAKLPLAFVSFLVSFLGSILTFALLVPDKLQLLCQCCVVSLSRQVRAVYRHLENVHFENSVCDLGVWGFVVWVVLFSKWSFSS